ncbi:Fanconi anemia core complex-associated protein 100 isoform X2 [Electrophorus electricus]|uniref:Fanconi anemia core complex-associated protein 100 isoform X2 n=1 Tax=Electrophorus electricus TaxID=8005 RepID=UPI0015CFAAF0|nr:Fanconi anemia core complex-associated protein 100 isoform X2 [Electrophorus electricus]
METVRCFVDCLADFGDLLSAKVIRNGTEVFLSTGASDVLVFNGQEKRVKTVLHFCSSVKSFALSNDRCRLYALCENDGLYCIPVALESSSHSLSAKCHIPALSTVSKDSTVIKDGKVQSFIVVEGILVTVSMQESFWTFELYELPDCSEGAMVYQRRAGFQVQVVAARIPQKHMADTVDSKSIAPALACIYPSSDNTPNGQAHLGHPLLEPLLFRLLFGVDTSLVHSPVILCGLPDGRLFFFPLLLPMLTSSRGEQKPQIKMLYSLEQPVTFIGTSVTGEKGPQYLVVIGQRGRILIAMANQEGSDGKAADCSSVELLALSLSGKLLQVTLPQASDKESLSRLVSSQVGQRVNDLMGGIGNIWERASSMKHQLQLKNNTLRCLNHVFNVCHLILNCHKNDQEVCERKPPISCRGVANWSTLLQKDSLILTCILENLSDCALHQGWTLCIEVYSSRSHIADGSSTTYSFALKKVDCGEKLEVNLPLDIDGEVFLPVKINCYLVYSLHSLFHPEELGHLSVVSDIPISQLLRDNGCISLALNTLTLDWLDCLRIAEPNSYADVPKQLTTWESTHKFLSSKQTRTQLQSMSKAGPHAVVVRISSELLRTGLSLPGCSTAVLCISVLKWLVFRTSETGDYKPIQNPVVCALGPGRHEARLLTKEVTVSGINSKGDLSVVEVQVESFSVEALCGLHHAVLRRVQALLKEAPVTHGGPVSLRGQHLTEAVQHAESLYKDLQDSRTPDTFGGVMKIRKTSELFQLYLQLRENPLVII